PPAARRRAAARIPSDHRRCRRCAATRPHPPFVSHSVWRVVPLPAELGRAPLRPPPPPGRLPGLGADPSRLRRAFLAGPQAFWHRPPCPRHEFRPGRGAGPVRGLERDPETLLPDRIQLPHRPGLLSQAVALLV